MYLKKLASEILERGGFMGIILLIVAIAVVMAVIRWAIDNDCMPLGIVGIIAVFILVIVTLGNVCNLSPGIDTTKDNIIKCEICLEAYHRGELSEEETRDLALGIYYTNERVRYLQEHQKSFFNGIFISNEEIEEIPLEPWMESIIARNVLKEKLKGN